MVAQQQNPFPGMGIDACTWLKNYLEAFRSADEPLDRDEVRAEAFRALPYVLAPAGGKTTWDWFVKLFNRAATATGFAFPGGGRGDSLVVQLKMTFAEFAELSIDQLIAARLDRDAVKARLAQWVEANQVNLDVDATFDGWCRAAGLA